MKNEIWHGNRPEEVRRMLCMRHDMQAGALFTIRGDMGKIINERNRRLSKCNKTCVPDSL